ncbi:MAG: hypothetical protein M1837_002756 [Sclerophora amabilis]|nr:MAG: hypothetical protein M1837_002756 [Sclerophora amabilis]
MTTFWWHPAITLDASCPLRWASSVTTSSTAAAHIPGLASPPMSHQTRPRPGRRRPPVSAFRSHDFPAILRTICLVISFLLICCPPATAAASGFEGKGPLLRSTLERLDRTGHILTDQRPAPFVSNVHRRQLESSTHQKAASASADSSATALSSKIDPPSPSTGSMTMAASPSTSSVVTDPNAPSDTPLPRPFDTSLGSNFTTSTCPDFFASFLANSTFKSCLPLSLLLQSSNSFFKAARSPVRIHQVLDATCDVDFETCSTLMNDLATRLVLDEYCGQDFEQENPLVGQAYNGFVAYGPLFQAGCLRSGSGSYCFADAITNTSSPADSYIYHLALGMSLPGGSQPTCNSCLQDSMSIFANAASDSRQPLRKNYVNAAQQIDLNCGPDFVNSTIPTMSSSASFSLLMPSNMGLCTWALFIILLTWLR